MRKIIALITLLVLILTAVSAAAESVYPEGALYPGVKEEEAVRLVQLQLIDLGVLKGSADGIYGPLTEAAVKEFQGIAGFPETGIADLDTIVMIDYDWRLLHPEASWDYPPCCDNSFDENGVHIYYCEVHSALMQAQEAMLAASETDVAVMHAWHLLKNMWQDDVEWFYESWMMISDDYEQKIVEADKTAFYEVVEEQKAELKADSQWSEDEKLAELFRIQSIYLCKRVYESL